MIKFQQSRALTSHFKSFWSIVCSLLRNFLFPCIGRPWNGVRRLHPFTVCFWTDVQTLQRPICNFWSNYHYSGHLACLCDWLISSVACNEDWTLTYTYLLHGSTKCCRSDLLELDLSHLKKVLTLPFPKAAVFHPYWSQTLVAASRQKKEEMSS